MDTGVAQACVIVGAIGGLCALDGIPRYLGLYHLGFLHLYRDRATDRWTRLLPVATIYIGVGLLALVALMVNATLWGNDLASIVLGVACSACAAATAVVLVRGPSFLLPPWAARMAARNWEGYWGDEADSSDPGTKLWATAALWVGVAAAVVAWVAVSPGFEKIWPLGLGAAAAFRTAASRSKGDRT